MNTMKFQHVSRLALPLLLVFFASCGEKQVPPPAPVEIKEVQLFMSRGSLTGTDFEQYKLLESGQLFVECGVSKGGRFIPSYQTLDNFVPQNSAHLKEKIANLLATQNFINNAFDSPGKSNTLFDPGKLELSFSMGEAGDMKKVVVSTSLDAVSDPSNKAESALFEIAKLFREGVSTTDALCKNRNFYGIPGKILKYSR